MKFIMCCKIYIEFLIGVYVVCIMMEWDEFKMYDWEVIYGVM